MCIKNKLKFVVPLFLICSLFTYCQNHKTEKNDFIKSFFEDVFINDKPLKVLYEQYIYKNSKTDKSKDEKIKIFNEHILYLKSEKEYLVKKNAIFQVENYDKSSISDLLPFNKSTTKNIYVVTIKNEVISYVLLNKGKVVSFNYVRKGSEGPAYFINNF